MPNRPPLVPHETFVADPVELPVRLPGEQGLSAVARADLIAADTGRIAQTKDLGRGRRQDRFGRREGLR